MRSLPLWLVGACHFEVHLDDGVEEAPPPGSPVDAPASPDEPFAPDAQPFLVSGSLSVEEDPDTGAIPTLCGAPASVAAGPAEEVYLGYEIPAETMLYGASSEDGAGMCCGWLFVPPAGRDARSIGMVDYATGEAVEVSYNVGSAERCGHGYCDELYYGDGRARPNSCAIVGWYEEGVVTAVGFSW